MAIQRLISVGSFVVVLVLLAGCGSNAAIDPTEPADQVSVMTEQPVDTIAPGAESRVQATETATMALEVTTEPQPMATDTPMPEPTAAPTIEPTATPQPTATDTLVPEPTATPTVEPTATPQPTATEVPPTPVEPVAILTGEFEGVGGDYTGSGSVTVYRLDDGSRVLRFTQFSVTNGPGLVVLLSNNQNVHLTRNINMYVELGELQSTTGDQEYQIPAELDVEEYSVAVIYCKPFNAVFATASLQ